VVAVEIHGQVAALAALAETGRLGKLDLGGAFLATIRPPILAGLQATLDVVAAGDETPHVRWRQYAE
jgi:hypothetical protein